MMEYSEITAALNLPKQYLYDKLFFDLKITSIEELFQKAFDDLIANTTYARALTVIIALRKLYPTKDWLKNIPDKDKIAIDKGLKANTPNKYDFITIDMLCLPYKLTKILQYEGIGSLATLICFSRPSLKNINKIGNISLSKIIFAINSYGIDF